MDRLLARLGRLDDAVALFAHGKDVPRAGIPREQTSGRVIAWRGLDLPPAAGHPVPYTWAVFR